MVLRPHCWMIRSTGYGSARRRVTIMRPWRAALHIRAAIWGIRTRAYAAASTSLIPGRRKSRSPFGEAAAEIYRGELRRVHLPDASITRHPRSHRMSELPVQG